MRRSHIFQGPPPSKSSPALNPRPSSDWQSHGQVSEVIQRKEELWPCDLKKKKKGLKGIMWGESSNDAIKPCDVNELWHQQRLEKKRKE